jgi:hypothetical protein
MGKIIHIQSPIVIKGVKPVQIENAVSIAIHCANSSTYPLNIGINQNASDNLQLEPGESISFGPYRDGDIIATTNFRFAFDTADANNKAIVIVSSPGEESC